MPASPADGAVLAAAILDTIHRLERQLIELVAARLRAGIGTTGWAEMKLAEILLLEQRLARGVQSATPALLDQVREVVSQAYIRGQALAVSDLRDHGVPFDVPTLAQHDIDLDADRAVENLRAALQMVPQLITDVYRDAVRAGAAKVLDGSLTRLQASQQVLDELAARGVTGFRDSAGRNWSLESYAEMAVRTAAGHAAVNGHVATLAASGMDLVIVSDAPRECPLCRPWEREILSISGRVGAILQPSVLNGGAVRVNVKAPLEVARAAGLFHPNCRHTVSAYLPGATKQGVAKHEPDRYEAGQRQREIERAIRAWKRRRAAALDAIAERRAAMKILEWQAALRAHVAEHELTRLPRRERIGTAI